jgi:transcriptional regulator with XRE-family HTH domain
MTAARKRLSMTPNQLVACNIAAHRKLRGWTQKETCDRLELLLGQRWSPAVLSAAERSAEGQQRHREFSADEIVAFSRLFGIPVGAFLQPPDDVEFAVPDRRRGLSSDEIVAVVEGIGHAEVRRQAQAIASHAMDVIFLATMKKIEGAATEDIAPPR